MTFEQWLLIALACASGAVSPGPSLALVIRHASESRLSGLACAWSHAAGVGVYALLAATGLAIVLAQHQWLDVAVSLAASLWLLRIALLSWQESDGIAEPGLLGRSALRDGLSMGLVNPKVALFFLALFTAALPPQTSPLDQTIAVVTAIVVDGAWYSLVVLVLQLQGVRPFLHKHTSWLGKLSALILTGFAIFLILRVLQIMAAA